MFELFKKSKVKTNIKPENSSNEYIPRYKSSQRVNLPVVYKEGYIDLEHLTTMYNQVIINFGEGKLAPDVALEACDHLLEQCIDFFKYKNKAGRISQTSYWLEFIDNFSFIIINKGELGILMHTTIGLPPNGFLVQSLQEYFQLVIIGVYIKPREIGDWVDFLDTRKSFLKNTLDYSLNSPKTSLFSEKVATIQEAFFTQNY